MAEIPVTAVRRYLDQCNKTLVEPYGTFWQRLIPGVCDHVDVRCVHGDEINWRSPAWGRTRRIVCRVCGRSLKGDLPEICFYTGKPHRGTLVFKDGLRIHVDTLYDEPPKE